jgi:hypothetical protein
MRRPGTEDEGSRYLQLSTNLAEELARLLWADLRPFINITGRDVALRLVPLVSDPEADFDLPPSTEADAALPDADQRDRPPYRALPSAVSRVPDQDPFIILTRTRLGLLQLARKRRQLTIGGRPFTAACASPLSVVAGKGSWELTHLDPWQGAAANASQLRARCDLLLALVSQPTVRRLLRECPTCGNFRILKDPRVHPEPNTPRRFCSTECRRQDPERRESARLRARVLRAVRSAQELAWFAAAGRTSHKRRGAKRTS